MYMNVSSSPHIRDRITTQSIMRDVCIALIPALVASYFIFGIRAILLTVVTVVASVVFEWLSLKIMKRSNTTQDLSAVVTGVLLAFCLPPSLPYWMVIVGAFIAIVVVKQMFGGLGNNFANPAIVGRIVLGVSFAGEMNTWSIAGNRIGEATADLVSAATPLASGSTEAFGYVDLLLGKHAGTVGEVSAIALLIGCVYLVVKQIIDLWIPATFIGTTLIFVLIFGQDPLFHLLSGGLLLGAIFMATDYVTSPTTTKGKIIFGIGCGLLTGLFRTFGASPEGVSFAILLMNILTPHIQKWTVNKTIGGINYAG